MHNSAHASVFLEAVMNGSPTGIVFRDRDLRWVVANGVACKSLGLTQKEVIGKTDFDLLPRSSANFRALHFEQVLATGEAFDFRESVVVEGGDVRTFDVTLYRVFDKTNNIDGLVSVSLDVSDRVQLEAELATEAVRAHELNQELDSFAHTVSHDLRSPLRAIDGYAKLLLGDPDEQLSDKTQHFLKQIDDGIIEMASLIDDLLNFSRATKSVLAQENVDLNALVLEVITKLNGRLDTDNIKIVIEDLPACVGDPTLLALVFNHLLSNSVKYAHQERRTDIKVGSLTHQVDGKTVLFVSDNGIGFDMAYVGKIFGVFERLHHPGEFEGNGIGLATAQRIVNRHGGRIWAEGQVGSGATFYFTLPTADSGNNPAAKLAIAK